MTIPEVTSTMGVLEHYVYAYRTFSGYVTYSYKTAQTCVQIETCNACPTTWSACGSGTPICDNSNRVQCGCKGNQVPTGTGSNFASASCSDTVNGGQCTSFTCNSGYAPDGYPTCSSGSWTGTTCKSVPCASDPTTANMDYSRTTCENTPLNGYCDFKCKAGYSKSGNNPQCSPSGVGTSGWTGSFSCAANQCSSSSPSSVSNVADGYCNTASGTQCAACSSESGCASNSNTYNCVSGYDPSGTATCTTGTWSGGSCVDGSCKSLPTFTHFSSLDTTDSGCNLNVASGKICNFNCDAGYEQAGTLKCFRETWSENTASCVPSPCVAIQDADIRNITGDACVGTASGTLYVLFFLHEYTHFISQRNRSIMCF